MNDDNYVPLYQYMYLKKYGWHDAKSKDKVAELMKRGYKVRIVFIRKEK